MHFWCLRPWPYHLWRLWMSVLRPLIYLKHLQVPTDTRRVSGLNILQCNTDILQNTQEIVQLYRGPQSIQTDHYPASPSPSQWVFECVSCDEFWLFSRKLISTQTHTGFAFAKPTTRKSCSVRTTQGDTCRDSGGYPTDVSSADWTQRVKVLY